MLGSSDLYRTRHGPLYVGVRQFVAVGPLAAHTWREPRRREVRRAVVGKGPVTTPSLARPADCNRREGGTLVWLSVLLRSLRSKSKKRALEAQSAVARQRGRPSARAPPSSRRHVQFRQPEGRPALGGGARQEREEAARADTTRSQGNREGGRGRAVRCASQEGVVGSGRTDGHCSGTALARERS